MPFVIPRSKVTRNLFRVTADDQGLLYPTSIARRQQPPNLMRQSRSDGRD
jgi:hypothetical protein